jgi:hypothetical protein
MSENQSKKTVDEDEIIEIPDTTEIVDLPEKEAAKDALPKPKGDNKLKKIWRKYLEKKKLTIPLTILVMVSILLVVPYTRYKIVGVFYKKSLEVTIVDSKTGKPVSEASVTIPGNSAKTDGSGKVTFQKVKVGPVDITIEKNYYATAEQNYLVPIKGSARAEFKLEATGRQVPVKVSNKITSKGTKGIVVKAKDSEARTDESGQAIIVLSPNSQTEKATLSGEGYNNQEIEIKVTDVDAAENQFTVTPAGKVYFLSKQSGKIDVVKTNLDGSDRQTVLAGTGREDDGDTVLLASRDWKYLALKSKRDDKTKLYLITTTDDKVQTIDEGNTYFFPSGWSNNHFIYTVVKTDVQQWQSKQQALKSFNADTKQLKTLDESEAEGASFDSYVSQSYGQIYILDNMLVYAKDWTAGYLNYAGLNGKRMSINSIRPDSSDKKMLRDFDESPDNSSYILGKLYKPQEVYFQVTQQSTTNTFFEYEDNEVIPATDVTPDTFNNFYPTYLISPSGNRTFWAEPRDGKNTLFLGNQDAQEQKEIASLSDFNAYGWFTETYLLVSKSGSELFILSPETPSQSLKITDYHKSNQNFAGYGYGYGGF